MYINISGTYKSLVPHYIRNPDINNTHVVLTCIQNGSPGDLLDLRIRIMRQGLAFWLFNSWWYHQNIYQAESSHCTIKRCIATNLCPSLRCKKHQLSNEIVTLLLWKENLPILDTIDLILNGKLKHYSQIRYRFQSKSCSLWVKLPLKFQTFLFNILFWT